MADALDSKSSAQKACGFESLLGQWGPESGDGRVERRAMLIQGHKRFKGEPFAGIQELRDFVADHRDVILGKPTVLLEPGELEKLGCFERTPDFVAIDVVSRHWSVVVIEPRGLLPESAAFRSLVKQEQIARRTGTRRSISALIIEQVKTRGAVLKSFESAGVHAIDVRDVLAEMFGQDPYFDLIVEEPSDGALQALTATAPSFRVWPVRKFVQEGARENVIYDVPESPRVSSGAPAISRPEVPAQVEKEAPKRPEVPEAPKVVPIPPPPPPVPPVVAPPAAGPPTKALEPVAAIPAPKVQEVQPESPGEGSAPGGAAEEGPGRRIGFRAPAQGEPAFLQVPDDENEVSLEDLVAKGYLRQGETLTKRYRWATGEVSQFEGRISADGGFDVHEVKNPPSDAQGRPEDGMWRTEGGAALADLKQRYIREVVRRAGSGRR